VKKEKMGAGGLKGVESSGEWRDARFRGEELKG
jgi:hypothetical protein